MGNGEWGVGNENKAGEARPEGASSHSPLPIPHSPLRTTLDRLAAGQRGRVVALKGDDALMQRLMEMGLLEGDEVELIGFAPLGDPLEVRLGDYRLSLRKA